MGLGGADSASSVMVEEYVCQSFMLNHFSLTSYFAGSAITGPIAKECADLWPRIASAANAIV